MTKAMEIFQKDKELRMKDRGDGRLWQTKSSQFDTLPPSRSRQFPVIMKGKAFDPSL